MIHRRLWTNVVWRAFTRDYSDTRSNLCAHRADVTSGGRGCSAGLLLCWYSPFREEPRL
jgi:hypothetical protein